MNELNIKFRQENGELRIMISSDNLLITTYWKNLTELKKNLKEAIEGTLESMKKESNSVINLKDLFKILDFWNINLQKDALEV
jgi:hypothetical protein